MAQIAPPSPVCNTGVYPPSPIKPISAFVHDQWPLGVWRWDWARATVSEYPEVIAQALISAAGVDLERVQGKGRFNYDHRLDLMHGGERVATILHGGRNGRPNVEASQERADWLVQVLRGMGVEWLPTRLDPCIDHCQEGLYEKYRTIALSIAEEFRAPNGKAIKFREISSPLDPFAGRTFYLGSREGEWFLRVYEKGLAEWKPGQAGEVPPDPVRWLVRSEAEIKPDKPEARLRAAQAEPRELFGVSPVLRAFAERALNVSVEPISLRVRREANQERALRAMGAQYHRHLAAVMQQCQGDLEAFGSMIATYAGLLDADAEMTG